MRHIDTQPGHTRPHMTLTSALIAMAKYIRSGQTTELKALLDQRPELADGWLDNVAMESGSSSESMPALYYAIKCSPHKDTAANREVQARAIPLLLEHGARLDTPQYPPALHYAVQQNAPEALAQLLASPRVDATLKHKGNNAIHTAVTGIFDMAPSAICHAATYFNGRDELHKRLAIIDALSQRIDINERNEHGYSAPGRLFDLLKHSTGFTADEYVPKTFLGATIMKLAEAGCDLNLPLREGQDIPLMEAVRNSNYILFDTLLWAGADLDAPSLKDGSTPRRFFLDSSPGSPADKMNEHHTGVLTRIHSRAYDISRQIKSEAELWNALCDEAHGFRPRALARAFAASYAINNFFEPEVVRVTGADASLKLAQHLLQRLPEYCTRNFKIDTVLRDASCERPADSALVQYMRGHAASKPLIN